MKSYKMFFTLLFSMVLALVALSGGASEAHAQGGATYTVTKARATGRYIQIELENGSHGGLRVILKKFDRYNNSYRFTNRGHYYIEGTDGSRTYTWGPYRYDSDVNNYAYYNTIWPENVLPHGEIWYRIRLYSENDPDRAKYTDYARARTNCPYDWWTGLYICS